MANSTVPAVKAALVSTFSTALTGQGVSVTWAAPSDEDDYVNEMVWLGDTDHDEEFRVLGAQRIDESYTVDVQIQTVKEGDNPQATEERWWAIRALCVNALRADLTLGGIVNQWIGPFPTRIETRPAGPKQWLSRGTVSLRCRARI